VGRSKILLTFSPLVLAPVRIPPVRFTGDTLDRKQGVLFVHRHGLASSRGFLSSDSLSRTDPFMRLKKILMKLHLSS